MDRAHYAVVLTERLGAESYSALEAMSADREHRLLSALGEGFGAIDRQFVAITATMNQNFEGINRNFEGIDRNFEAINRKFEAIDRNFEAIHEKFEAIDHKFQAVDEKFHAIDRHFDGVHHRFDVLDERIERRLAEETGKLRVETSAAFGQLRAEMFDGFGRLRVEMHDGFGLLRADMANQRADLMKWALLFWVTQAAAVAGIVTALR